MDNVIETKIDPISICNMPREDSDGNEEDDDRIELFEEERDGPCHFSPALKLDTDQCSGEAPCKEEVRASFLDHVSVQNNSSNLY